MIRDMTIVLLLIALVVASLQARQITETELLARTIYAEAGNQSIQGKLAVASVIYNRKHHTENVTWANVVLKPRQFSCWNDPKKSNSLDPNKESVTCLAIAESMVEGAFEPVGPWTHYYNPRLCNPSWGDSMINVKVIEDHRFGVLR